MAKAKDYLFFQSINRFTKNKEFNKNLIAQSLNAKGGKLPNSTEIYLAPFKTDASNKNYQTIYVDENNIKSATTILQDYANMHHDFGIVLDTEILQTYHLPKNILSHYAKLLNFPYVEKYNANEIKFNPRLHDENYRKYQNELLKKIIQHHSLNHTLYPSNPNLKDEFDINKYIIKNYDYFVYENQLATYYTNIYWLNFVAFYYHLPIPVIPTEIIKLILKENINPLKSTWFSTWYEKHASELQQNYTNYFIDLNLSQDDIAQYLNNNALFLVLNANHTIDFQASYLRLLNSTSLNENVAFSFKKQKLNDLIKAYNAFTTEPLSEFFLSDKADYEIDYEEQIKIFDTLLAQHEPLSNYVKHSLDNDFFPFFIFTYTIENTNFVFMENAIVDAGINNVNEFSNLGHSWIAFNYFTQLLIAKNVPIITINGKGFDIPVVQASLCYKDVFSTSTRIIKKNEHPAFATSMAGATYNMDWKFMGIDLTNYWKQKNPINDYVYFMHLYTNDDVINPYLNFKSSWFIDIINESKSGATDEHFGTGLKEMQSNMGLDIVENIHGLSFDAKLPNEITNENLKNLITYNLYDTFSTTLYANIYLNNQLVAKNSIINASGQGADLFSIKDDAVSNLLNLDTFNYTYDKKEQYAIYTTFLKRFEDALNTQTLTLNDTKILGINPYLENFLNQNEIGLKTGFKQNLIGFFYRLCYFALNDNEFNELMLNHNNVAFSEFGTLNQVGCYFNSFIFDFAKTIPPLDNYKKLSIINNLKNEVLFDTNQGLILQNLKLQSFILSLKNELMHFITTSKEAKVILKVYNAYQHSDSSVLAELSKLKQTALYESQSNGQLVQVSAVSGIELSKDNPLWLPKYQMNINKYSKTFEDTSHPYYERIKYLYQYKNMFNPILVALKTTNELDKPVKDANNDDFLTFRFDTYLKLDETNYDDNQFASAIKHYNTNLIYIDKPLKLLEKERINNANYYNLTKKYYPSFSRNFFNVTKNHGLNLYFNNQLINVPLSELTNVQNWTLRRKKEFINDELNAQDYLVLVFNYLNASFELNGLSIDWSYDANNNLTTPTKINYIKPYEVKYSAYSKDNYNLNGEARFELGLEFEVNYTNTTSPYNLKYRFRLDSIHPNHTNSQINAFYNLAPSFNHSILYAIDEKNNLAIDESIYEWGHKKSNNKALSLKFAHWFETHPQHKPKKTKARINNAFYVHMTNSNNQTFKPTTTEIQKAYFSRFDTLVYLKGAGLHADVPMYFTWNSKVFGTDPDYRSYYPAIDLAWLKIVSTFNAEWFLRFYNKQVQAKILKKTIERTGLKLGNNTVFGKTTELDSVLADTKLVINLLRYGQLGNLEMQLTIGKMMHEQNHPFTLYNGNTDGNGSLTDEEGAIYLQNNIIDTLYAKHLDETSIKNYNENNHHVLDKFIETKKFQTWKDNNVPWYFIKRNIVEIGALFNGYYQNDVNHFFGTLTAFIDKTIDKKANPDIYHLYETYCTIDEKDTSNDVRVKVYMFYSNNRNNLPADFNLNTIVKNTKVKGFYACWQIIMELEQNKIDNAKNNTNHMLLNNRYNRFGKGAIIDFSTIERILYNIKIEDSIKRYNDLGYFCYNAKKTNSYDNSLFTNLDNSKTIELAKNTRFIIAKSKDKTLLGNISKIKKFKKESLDEQGLVDLYKENKIILNMQLRIQEFALNLNAMVNAMGYEDVCELNECLKLNHTTSIYLINFNTVLFNDIYRNWDELKKDKQYQTYSSSKKKNNQLLNIISAKDLMKVGLNLLKVDEKDFHFADIFSTYLTYDKDNKLFDVVISMYSKSKFVGTINANDNTDANGFYQGNFIINEKLDDTYYLDNESGQLIYKQTNMPSGVYVDYNYYKHMVLNNFWNLQRNYLESKLYYAPLSPWIMTPAELVELSMQDDISVNWKKSKSEVKAYLSANNLTMGNVLTYKKDENDLHDELVDEDENDEEDTESKTSENASEEDNTNTIKKPLNKVHQTPTKLASQIDDDSKAHVDFDTLFQAMATKNK